MAVNLFQVDSFAEAPFTGNPAAVCLLSDPADERWMQAVAAEMNLAATAFVDVRHRGGASGFGLRWFTPTVELTLCGHGTLAAANILWEEGIAADDHVAFDTVAGMLAARREGAWIHMDFPAEPEHQELDASEQLAACLGVTPLYIGRNRLDYLAEVESEDVVQGLSPDLRLLAKLPVRGVIVTARGSREYDFVSRYFAPAIGIDEDQVTGSAHCCLGPFWGSRLGKDDLVAYQASPRGGVVRIRLAGDRIELGGMAITVFRGELV